MFQTFLLHYLYIILKRYLFVKEELFNPDLLAYKPSSFRRLLLVQGHSLHKYFQTVMKPGLFQPLEQNSNLQRERNSASIPVDQFNFVDVKVGGGKAKIIKILSCAEKLKVESTDPHVLWRKVVKLPLAVNAISAMNKV